MANELSGSESAMQPSAKHGLTQEDLKWLVCPVCRSALRLEAGGGAVPVSVPGHVRCLGCSRVYPIVDGLPVLLAERSRVASGLNIGNLAIGI